MKKWKNMALLIDITKCIGCEECVDACKKENGLPAERLWPWTQAINSLSSARWTTIRRFRSEKGIRFIKRQCRHCLEPACVEACIVGALQKTADGPVTYDPSICIGCRYCMIVCPWEIPRYSWENTIPYIQKCDLCYDRIKDKGAIPACVTVCPTKAILFGERDELLAEAKKRLGESPETYINHIWGEHEVGGASVLYISDVTLNLSNLPKPITDKQAMPHRTFKILHQMPLVFVGMVVTMGGIHMVIKRRQELMEQSLPQVNQGAQQPPHQNLQKEETGSDLESSPDQKGEES